MNDTPARSKSPILLFGIFLVSRVLYMFLSSKDWIYDQFEYGAISQHFLRTGRLLYTWCGKDMPTAYFPPALIFLFSFFNKYCAAHLFLAFAIFNLLTACVGFFVFRKLSSRLLSERAALYALCLYVLDLNMFSVMRWANETFYTTVLVSALWIALANVYAEKNKRNLTLLGISLGIGLWFREIFLVYCFFVLLFLLARKSSWKECLRVLLIAAVLIAPWTIRNYLVTGKFIPVCNQLGSNIWEGWNPDSVGAMFKWDGSPIFEEPALVAKLSAAKDEAEVQSTYTKYSIQCALDNPLRWVKQRVLGTFFFWSGQSLWAPKNHYHTRKNIIAGIYNLVLIGVFFLSLPLAWRYKPIFKGMIAFVFLHSSIYMAIHADVGNRYRIQIEPLILLMIAIALDHWSQSCRKVSREG